MPRVRQRIRVGVRVRARIVANAVYEWIVLAGYEGNGLEELIKEAIIKEQIIQSISLAYSKPKGTIVAIIEFVFNWNNSTLSLRGSDESLLDGLDEGIPLTEQTAKTLTKMIREVTVAAKEEKGASDVRLTFRYISCLEARTGKSRDDWNKELGCEVVPQQEADRIEKFRRIHVRDGDLGGMVGVNFILNEDYFDD